MAGDDVFFVGHETVRLKDDQPRLFTGDFIKLDAEGYWRNVHMDEATHILSWIESDGRAAVLPRAHRW